MKKVYLFIVLAILPYSAIPTQAQAQKDRWHFPANNTPARSVFLYTLTTLNESYNDLTGSTSINNGELWDDPEYVVPIGFTFELNGNPVTALQFFGAGSLLAAPTTDPDFLTAVFPFEMDLIDRGEINGTSISPLSYKVEGSPGSRICKIEWKNAGSFEELNEANSLDMFINFQLWLYEGSNTIEFRFGSNNINNPDLFYGGFSIYLGVTDLDEETEDLLNPHFFGGTIDAPFLVAAAEVIEGTPTPGTVYKLSLDLPVEVTVTGQNSTSTCQPNGTASAEATGGVEPYSYLWNTTETASSISFLDAGTYTVTVTDDNGTTTVGSVTITNVGPINPNASATDETSVDGNDGTATSSTFGGSPPYSFEWSNSGTTQTITNLAPGVYTVTVTDSEDCFALESVIVGAFGCPEIIIDADILNATCFGVCDGEIDLTVTGGSVPYIYFWSNGFSGEDAFGLCAGDYFVTLLDADGCTMNGGPYTVSQSPEIVANAGATDETSAGANDGTAWAAPTGGLPPYTYSWSNGGTDSLIVNLPVGDYTVVVTDAAGCEIIESISVDPFSCLGSIESAFLDPSCYTVCDGSASVALIGGVGPITYVWSTGDTTNNIFLLCDGTYEVTITDIGQNCVANLTFDIIEPDSLYISVDQVIHVTDSTQGSIFTTPIGGTSDYAFIWLDASGTVIATTEDITGVGPGIYYPGVIDANGCTFFLDGIEVLDNTVGTITLINTAVRLFPNPANEQVYIEIDDITGFNIILRGPDGRMMRSWQEEKMIDVSSIPAGIYVVEGISGSKMFRQRLVIAR